MSASSGWQNIAIYGDVNANIIDGSSVWLKNIVKLTLANERTQVWLFLKAPILRGQLLEELVSHPRIRIIEPTSTYLNGAEAMKVEDAVFLIESYDETESFNAIVLRGMDLCYTASKSEQLFGRLWTYITDFSQSLVDVTDEQCLALEQTADASKYVLCQTEELRSHFTAVLSKCQSKLVIVPPVVPASAYFPLKNVRDDRPIKILYSGKFAPEWATETLIDVFSQLRADGLNVELHVAGDKFHKPKNDPGFASRVRRKLESSIGVFWHGGLPQEEVFELQKSCHIGFGWRHKSMDGSLELSTKLLEYGASGLALVANSIAIHRNLFGEDYPLFANDKVELREVLEGVVGDTASLETAARQVQVAAESHKLEVVAATWRNLLDRVYHSVSSEVSPIESTKKLKVVLAGHDLKFADELVEYFEARPDIELRIDHWDSLREHQEAESKKLAAWANLVFCEWCAGNAVWYSRNIDPTKVQLLVRFHRFEINSEFPPKIAMENVYKILFVGPHFQRQALEKYGWNSEQCELVPNFVDASIYQRPKFTGSNFNLGLIGYVPKLKRLDRALDILASLRSDDHRYKLYIKGKHPWEYPWIWRNKEERAFYETQLERIKEDDLLRNAVVFDPFGDDVAHWLRKIGFVLSVSDLESFHLAAAEGIASGARPVFIDREGVEEVFPWEVINDDIGLASEYIANYRCDSELVASSKQKLIAKYGVSTIRSQLDQIVRAG